MSVLSVELLLFFDDLVIDVFMVVIMLLVIYIDEEFMVFERDALFLYEWLCVGVALFIFVVGDFFLFIVNDELIIVVCGKDGVVWVFLLVC